MSATAPERPRVVRDVILRDGGVLRLRSPDQDDAPAIKRFYDELDERSRYLRFHGFGRTGPQADDDASADMDTRAVLTAVQGDRVVAVAGYHRLRDADAAEVAFAVADELQGRGVGAALLQQLAEYAAGRGIRRFDADVLSNNRPMLAVFQGAGFRVRRETLEGDVHLTLDITPSPEHEERVAERLHRAAVASLRPVLAPRSVAVVGASDEPGSVGGRLFERITSGGFRGVAWPVNRAGGIVRSTRAARSLDELPEAPELAIIAVPAQEVQAVCDDAARVGVKALVVVARGFSDAGDAEGGDREARLLEAARTHGLRLVGPNSLGVVNLARDVRLRATVGPCEGGGGRVAISSQSGALGLALLGHASLRRLGIASFVALGNRADVSTNDLLEFWADDAGVAVVMLYVETFGNPRRFSQVAQRVSRRKPILAVKGRRAPLALADARSHTAAAMRGETVFDALLRQAGVLRCPTTEELFDAAELLDRQPLPRGRRIAIVTNSGGLGTLGADAAAASGLELTDLDEATRARLRGHVPTADRTRNPVDLGIGASPQAYRQAVEDVLASDAVDAVLVFSVDLAGQDPEAVLEAVASAGGSGAEKPVVASVLASDGRLARGAAPVVPNLRFPESCVGALARAVERHEWLARPLGQPRRFDDVDPDAARARAETLLAAGGGWIATADCEALLGTHGIAWAPTTSCATADEAVAAAAAAGGPVALKADFPPPAHAGDVDASLLGLDGEVAVRAGWDELRRRVAAAGREWAGARVQPFVGGGADALVGAVGDPELGPVIGVGLGGRQAGLASDVAFRLARLTDTDADELIDHSPGVAAQLDGFRGGPPLDRVALRELILRFSMLLETLPELVEVDLNPVRLLPQGCVVLDVRMRLERRPPAERVKTW